MQTNPPDLKTFLENNAIALTTIIFTPLLAWVFNRKKETSDITKTNTDASSVIVKSSSELATSWEIFATQIKMEYNDCITRTNLLETKVNLVTSDNMSLRLEQNIIKAQNKNLKEFTTRLSDFVETLLTEIDKINPELAQRSKVKLSSIKEEFQSE